MRSIRKFAYAATLGLGIFALHPTLAAAEDAHGSFTLTHEVHWQKCVLRAGDYTFSMNASGSPTYLVLRGINGTGTDAMLLVNDIAESKPDELSKIDIVSRDGQSFVSAMTLPNYDMTLRFAVPHDGSSK
jgi:hypothetical protein